MRYILDGYFRLLNKDINSESITHDINQRKHNLES